MTGYQLFIYLTTLILGTLEFFLEICLTIRTTRSKLACDIAWSAFDYMQTTGLALQIGPLFHAWNIMKDCKEMRYLPYVANYLMERPDNNASKIFFESSVA